MVVKLSVPRPSERQRENVLPQPPGAGEFGNEELRDRLKEGLRELRRRGLLHPIAVDAQAWQRVSDVLHRLPGLRPIASDVLEEEAQSLCMRIGMAMASNGPNRRRAGTAKATRALDQFEKSALQLSDAIKALPADALAAVDQAMAAISGSQSSGVAPLKRKFQDAQLHPLLLTSDLSVLALLATLARKSLDRESTVAERRTNVAAVQIADAAAELYTRLTGMAATRISEPIEGKCAGPFEVFLGELFQMFGVEASASYAIRRRRSSPGRRPGRPKAVMAKSPSREGPKRH